MSEVAFTVSIRGVAEWLLRDYLADLGAAPDPDRPARMTADGWAVTWASRRERVEGSALTLTTLDLEFTGAPDAVEAARDALLRKAQRGGG